MCVEHVTTRAPSALWHKGAPAGPVGILRTERIILKFHFFLFFNICSNGIARHRRSKQNP